MRRYRFVVILLLLCAGSTAFADHYFYSVADDIFFNNNELLWNALEPYPDWDSSRALLRDDWNAYDGVQGGRDTMYEDLLYYADTLESGDMFMYSYWGHGGWTASDSYYTDEGSTSRPQTNDPSPSNSAPYAEDEYYGTSDTSNGIYPMWDDDLTNVLDQFDPGVQVIVISGACHSGGLVGGSHDIQTSNPATNGGLHAMLGAPEQGLGIGIGNDTTGYDILLNTALINTLSPYTSAGEWYDSAVEWGESAYYSFQRPWDSSAQPYYFWPDENWTPTAYEQTYHDYSDDNLDRWGWEETYWQLRPEEHSWLDTEHNNDVCTPEPATTALFLVGAFAIPAALRRRRNS